MNLADRLARSASLRPDTPARLPGAWVQADHRTIARAATSLATVPRGPDDTRSHGRVAIFDPVSTSEPAACPCATLNVAGIAIPRPRMDCAVN